VKRRDFLIRSAAGAAASLVPALARAGVPVAYDWNAMPPLADRQGFIDWAVKTRGEEPKYLGERYDRFLVLVKNGDLKDDINKRAFLMTPRESFVLAPNLARA
jgi:protein-L-isoaspartate(D-aspartate) O-methyltransferase